MADEFDDRSQEDKAPSMHRLDRNLAVLTERVQGFQRDMDKKWEAVEQALKDLQGRFVTHDEFERLQKDHDGLKNSIYWMARIVIGGVLMAVLGLVLVKGGVKP